MCSSSLETRNSGFILASTAFQIVSRAFATLPPTERKCFRLANFTSAEALAFLKICEQDIEGLSDTRIVVAHDAPDDFPEQYRASKDETITTCRNSIRPGHGLIYIETKAESDSQGLQNFFTLHDINFLDGSFDGENFNVAREIVANAIRSTFGSADQSSDLLISRCVEVLEGLRSGDIVVSVRKFAAFSLAVACSRHEAGGVMDSAQIDALVGRSLTVLGLFPDELWRNDTSATRISRRLTQNLLHAELASSHSSDLDQDKLIEQCKRTVFREGNGENLPAAEQGHWRNLCGKYCGSPAPEIRRDIPYRIFEQLFARDVKGLPLGDRVAEEVDESASGRIPELNNLGVIAGLNRRSPEDARRFLESESAETDLPPLRDTLSKPTRRMVEKVAYPNPEQFDNPLIKIAQISEFFRRRSDSGGKNCTLKLQLGRNADPSAAANGLFSFLYGATLKSVCEASRFTTDGMILEVDDYLTTIIKPPDLVDADNEAGDGDEETAISWLPVPLEFVLIDHASKKEVDSEQSFEWYPAAINHLALYWLMTTAPDAPTPEHKLKIPGVQSADSWMENIAARTEPLCSCISETLTPETLGNGLVAALIDSANEFRSQCASEGISTTILDDSFDRWNDLLATTKDNCIPQGRPDPQIEAFLRHECVLGSEGKSMLMLASHPLRARWISRYLKKSEELAIKALNGELPLNSQNETLYLNWIANLSPHQSPAIHLAPDGERLISVREHGWTEEFSPLRPSAAGGLSETIGPAALLEIAKQVTTYLEAHPYKRDGLSLLIVSPGAPKLPAELAEL